MLEQTAGISEFNSKKFIKIGQEINSGQFFEKMFVYMKYIVNILSRNRIYDSDYPFGIFKLRRQYYLFPVRSAS